MFLGQWYCILLGAFVGSWGWDLMWLGSPWTWRFGGAVFGLSVWFVGKVVLDARR